MQVLPYIFIAVSAIIILVIVRMWFNKLESSSQVSDELVSWLKDLGNRIDQTNTHVDAKLSHNMDMFNKRLDRSAEAMMHVQRTIGEFSEIGRSMQELQTFLQSPKLRGNIGEQVLKELLSQSLPREMYSLQHSFQDGSRADAVVQTTQGLIVIDSKFPLSNFKKMIELQNEADRSSAKKEFIRDVKQHISSISKKYILPSEGTLDYALMYIPSESVYYEIINSEDLYDYASEHRIVPVSPMSFYAYLRVILVSHEGLRVQQQAKEILSSLKSMQKYYEATEGAATILNKHIVNAYSQSSTMLQELSKLGHKLESTSSLSASDQKSLGE
ncbi:MAG: DNA recombination protein RmuC [bacterium]|nr:DNA recombination protein RmuC [bacterium]